MRLARKGCHPKQGSSTLSGPHTRDAARAPDGRGRSTHPPLVPSRPHHPSPNRSTHTSLPHTPAPPVPTSSRLPLRNLPRLLLPATRIDPLLPPDHPQRGTAAAPPARPRGGGHVGADRCGPCTPPAVPLPPRHLGLSRASRAPPHTSVAHRSSAGHPHHPPSCPRLLWSRRVLAVRGRPAPGRPRPAPRVLLQTVLPLGPGGQGEAGGSLPSSRGHLTTLTVGEGGPREDRHPTHGQGGGGGGDTLKG